MITKLRLNYWHKQRNKLKEYLDNVEQPNRPIYSKIWRRFWYFDKKIYRYEQKQWIKQIIAHVKEAEPYGAFYWIPQIFIDMIKRAYEYWNNGYNVHVANPWASSIREQVTHAWQLAQDCMSSENYIIQDEFDPAKLVELFTYVAQHINEWSD